MRNPFEQLRNIREAITKIERFVSKGRSHFDQEEEIRLSIVHYLQTIQEATQNISQSFKEQHPEFPWTQMLGFRQFLTHYYLEIDHDQLWNIAAYSLPKLKELIDKELEGGRTTEDTTRITPATKNETRAIEGLLQAKREEILDIATKYGASNVRLFGSIARGVGDAESDIDLLVDMEPGRSFFDLSELLCDLQDLLGREVDAVTAKGLNERIRERVLKEAIPL